MTILPWIMSAATIAVMWLAGNKSPWAWRLSLANQVLWSVWIVASQTWGLVPMNLAMYVVAWRNLSRWRFDSAQVRNFGRLSDAREGR